LARRRSNVTTANNVICIGQCGGVNVKQHLLYRQHLWVRRLPEEAPFSLIQTVSLDAYLSRRFKEEIKPIEEPRSSLFLKPVSFRYKKEIDPGAHRSWAWWPKTVEKVKFPHLVVRDQEERPTVRYDQVNAMLLNEFSKSIGRLWKSSAQVAPTTKPKLMRSSGTLKNSDLSFKR